MKIAIIGSRKFMKLYLVREKMLQIGGASPDLPKITIISGGAEGVDTFAIATAKWLGLDHKEILPDKSLPSPARYHIRNDKIVETADKVIAFWDGSSRGTKSVIDKCLQRRKNLEVIFDNEDIPSSSP